MKKRLIILGLTAAILFGCSSLSSFAANKTIKTTPKLTVTTTAPAVKKSVNNLCHAKGTRYYNQTKKFKAYKTIKDCLKSGGKLPKK